MKYLAVGILSVLGGVIGAWLTLPQFVPPLQQFGATVARTTITNPWTFSSTTQLGSSGTQIVRANAGFCNIQASANTIAASTTKTVDCVNVAGTPPGTALTGVSAGDRCFLSPATTTSTVYEGLKLSGVSASSTQGYITVNLFNGTGTTFTWTAAASSSWQYICNI